MRINNYVKDTLVTANDKWIGSDFNNFSQTKNFTPITIADFYNSNQVLNSPYLSFTYKTYPGGIIEEDGIISFYDNNADIVPFSSITQFLVSAKSANANTIADYLDFINGGKITLSRGTDVNSFGFFKITNVVPYDENTNFFLLTVEYITGHGDLLKDKSYMMTLLFDKYSYNQTLQDVTNNGNTTTNDIILNSISGEYGDYTVINTLKDLGLFPVFSSILGEDYSSYYAGYGFGSSSSLGTLSKAIDAYESSFYVQSLDTSNSNYTGSIGLEGTDANGSPFLSLTNKTRNIGKLKVTNIVNAITLQFPNKIPGDYTIATIDDIISPEGFVPYIGATSDVDLGNVNIIGQYLNFYTGFNYENFFTIDNSSGKGVYIFPDKISLSTNGLGINGIIKSDLLTTIDKTYQLPNNSGTLALTSDVPTITGHALTKVNDTNVTLTLGGTPSTSLLQDVSLTLGWTGTLADSRIASASSWNAKQNAITTGTTSQYLRGDLSLATFPTNVSSFTNDSGYLVSSALTPYLTSALAASTYEPKIVAGTTSQYWRGDKTWQAFPTIPTVGTWGALNYPTWSSGTPFVKMTASGTFALDTNTYLTGITSGQVTTALGYTPVTNARTLTINGTSYDLTSDRSWTISTFTSPLTTKGDLFTYNSTNARLPIGLDTQVLVADSTSATGMKWATNTPATQLGYYGSFEDNTIQTAAAINTPYAMKLGITDLSNGITVVSDGSNLTRITIANTGVYNIQFSAQFDRTNSGTDSVDIWLRKNGVDVPGSGGRIVLAGGAAASAIIATWNYVLSVVGGDYYQLMWSTPDTHVRLLYEVAQTSPFAHPIIPSVILTVTQQSGIMAGTGLTAINSLIGAVQTLTTGTTGTDFAIVDSGTDHKFNLPDASTTARGVVTTGAQTIAGAKTFSTAPILSSLTASQILATDASKNIQSLDVATYPSLTELSYAKGVTSSIQTQLGTKAIDSAVVHITGTETITGKKTLSPSVTASGAIAQGTILTPSLTAAANNDVLVGLDINPTFSGGSFTGTSSIALRVAGNILPDTDNTRTLGTGSQGFNLIWVRTIRSNNTIGFYPGGVLAATISASQNFLIGTSSDTASSILKLESTTKGFLPPRMTNAQRTAITSPAIGLMVYCTDTTEGVYVYKSTGWAMLV